MEQAWTPPPGAPGGNGKRRRLVKMGDRTEALCRKAHDPMAENPALPPGNLDVAERAPWAWVPSWIRADDASRIGLLPAVIASSASKASRWQ